MQESEQWASSPGAERENEGESLETEHAVCEGAGSLLGKRSEVELQARVSRVSNWPDETEEEHLDVRWQDSRSACRFSGLCKTNFRHLLKQHTFVEGVGPDFQLEGDYANLLLVLWFQYSNERGELYSDPVFLSTSFQEMEAQVMTLSFLLPYSK